MDVREEGGRLVGDGVVAAVEEVAYAVGALAGSAVAAVAVDRAGRVSVRPAVADRALVSASGGVGVVVG